MIERVSSLSLDEFRRHLPYALRGLEYRWVNDSVVEVEGLVTITAEDLPRLVLSGALSLPRIRVSFTFHEGDGAEFMAGYDRAFQRGGG